MTPTDLTPLPLDAGSLAEPHVLPLDAHPVATYLARLSVGSRRAQREALEGIARALSGGARGAFDLPWPLLRYQHAAALRTWLVRRYQARTVNRHLSALRGVVQEAQRLGILSAEEARAIGSVRGPRVTTPPAGRQLSAEELGGLLRAAGPRDAALFALLYGAGLRRSEAVALTLTDVDVGTGRIQVRRGKGGKDRVCAVPPGALAPLETWAALRGGWEGPFLAVYVRGKVEKRSITPQAVYDALRRLARRAGIAAGFSPHDLRRSWISDLLDAGADLVSVQRLAGHADPRVTAGYDRREERARMAAAARLPFPVSREPLLPFT